RVVIGGLHMALVTASLLHLWRRESALVLRCLLIAVLGAAATRLIAQANASALVDLLVPIVVAMTPFLAAIALMLALSIGRAQSSMRWMTLSSGVSDRHVVTASFALLVGACAL